MQKYFQDSYMSFARGDQSVSDMYFTRRESLTLVNEDWATFVFRCQCEDFTKDGEKRVFGSPSSPVAVHFTGWFRPHVHKDGIVQPAGLSQEAKACSRPVYDHWEQQWERVIANLGLRKGEMLEKPIRHTV